MGQAKTILVSAGVAALVTGTILKFAVPLLVDRAARKMLAASALVMSEGLTTLANTLECNIKATSAPDNLTTTTWPVPYAALNYVQ